MPEVLLELCWPDGNISPFYSPSTVVYDYFKPGDTLTIAELEEKGLAALRDASERVRKRYGFSCTRTDEEASRLRQRLVHYPPEATVDVRALHA